MGKELIGDRFELPEFELNWSGSVYERGNYVVIPAQTCMSWTNPAVWKNADSFALRISPEIPVLRAYIFDEEQKLIKVTKILKSQLFCLSFGVTSSGGNIIELRKNRNGYWFSKVPPDIYNIKGKRPKFGFVIEDGIKYLSLIEPYAFKVGERKLHSTPPYLQFDFSFGIQYENYKEDELFCETKLQLIPDYEVVPFDLFVSKLPVYCWGDYWPIEGKDVFEIEHVFELPDDITNKIPILGFCKKNANKRDNVSLEDLRNFVFEKFIKKNNETKGNKEKQENKTSVVEIVKDEPEKNNFTGFIIKPLEDYYFSSKLKNILEGKQVHFSKRSLDYDRELVNRSMNIIKKGKINSNVFYEITDDDTLIIFGSGRMESQPYLRVDNQIYSKRNIKRVIIENGITNVSDNAFEGCEKLYFIKIPNTVVSIGKNSFRGCSSLEFIDIPNSVKTIGEYAFYDCGALKELNIPDSVTKIGCWAFAYCSQLKVINIPKDIEKLELCIFRGCCSLSKIILLAKYPPEILDENLLSLPNLYNECSLYIRYGKIDLFRENDKWNKFLNIIEDKSTKPKNSRIVDSLLSMREFYEK